MLHVNVHRRKYFELYQQMALSSAKQSVALKRQVGCVIVTPSGMIAPGWNGMPAGFPNQCEQPQGQELVTDHRVIHAECNALDKLALEGIPVKGSLVFTTTAPCMDCAKRLYGAGVIGVHYQHRYSDDRGLQFLQEAEIPCEAWDGLPTAGRLREIPV